MFILKNNKQIFLIILKILSNANNKNNYKTNKIFMKSELNKLQIIVLKHNLQMLILLNTLLTIRKIIMFHG